MSAQNITTTIVARKAWRTICGDEYGGEQRNDAAAGDPELPGNLRAGGGHHRGRDGADERERGDDCSRRPFLLERPAAVFGILASGRVHCIRKADLLLWVLRVVRPFPIDDDDILVRC